MGNKEIDDSFLETSKYLFKVERKEGTVVYHSLFGNISIFNDEALKLLFSFKNGKKKEEVLKKYDEIKRKKSNEYIHDFLKKGFLIKKGTDEDKEFEDFYEEHKKIIPTGRETCIIQLVVSNICNFDCKYCFVEKLYSSKERISVQNDANNKIMSKENAKKYIDIMINHIKKNERNNLFIQFFGGEPLTNWPVVKYVLDEYKNGENHGINILYSIITNGSLINEEIAKYFKRFDVNVIISFDSPKGTDRLLKNGENSGPIVKKNIALLAKYENRTTFNTAITSETFGYFGKDLVDFAVKNKVKEIGILFDLILDLYKKHSSQEIVDKFWEVYLYAKENDITVTGYWHHTFQLILEDRHFKNGAYKTCPAMGALFSIEPNGEVFACKTSSAYYGNMNKIDEIFNSDKYIEYSKFPFKRINFCRNCEIENFCSNICTGVREKNFDSISTMHQPTCKIKKEIVKRQIIDYDIDKLELFKL